MSCNRSVALALGFVALLSCHVANADPDPPAAPRAEHLEQARALFREGVKHARSGKWSDAQEVLLRSAALVPHAATLYNLALCSSALDRPIEARSYLSRSLRRAARDPSELPAGMQESALAALREVDSKLARLELRVQARVGVSVDGFGLDSWSEDELTELTLPFERPPESGLTQAGPGLLVLVLTPGAHEIVIESAGRRQVMAVDAEAGTTQSLALELREAPEVETAKPADQPAPKPVVAVMLPPSGVAPRAEPAGRSALQLPAFGVAAVGTASAIVFGILALDTKSELDRVCPEPERCPAGTGDDVSALRLYSVLTDISLATALAGAGVGVYVTLSPPKSAGGPARAAVQAGVRF